MSPLPHTLQRPAAMLLGLANSLRPIAALLTRLVVGWTFVGTGLGKLQHFDKTTEFFTSIGIPFPAANAAFIGGLELVGGVMLMVGLGTRIFAALLSATMIVAILTADRADFLAAFHGGDKGLLDVTPVPFLLFLGWLVAFGAGAISIDRLFGKSVASA